MLVGFNSIPKVAVVPVFVIWFGIGTIPAVLTAFLVSFFPIAVNVATGLATIEPELLDVMRSLGASKRKILMKDRPAARRCRTSSRRSRSRSRWHSSERSFPRPSPPTSGIGYLMMAATANFDTPLVFAGLIVIAVMGIVMYALFAIVEQSMTFWAKRGEGLMA